jgi:hypothetical protein
MEWKNRIKEFFMRKYYILQLRSRNQKDRYIPNTEEFTISVFSSFKNVINWIKIEGVLFSNDFLKIKGNKNKKCFWAVEVFKLNQDYCDIYLFYDLKGQFVGNL